MITFKHTESTTNIHIPNHHVFQQDSNFQAIKKRSNIEQLALFRIIEVQLETR